jgi:hypothetical protein
MPGYYARTFLRAMREAKPELEQELKRSGDLGRILGQIDRSAPEQEESLFAELLHRNPLPEFPVERIAKADQLRRQSREITLASVLEPLAESPHYAYEDPRER